MLWIFGADALTVVSFEEEKTKRGTLLKISGNALMNLARETDSRDTSLLFGQCPQTCLPSDSPKPAFKQIREISLVSSGNDLQSGLGSPVRLLVYQTTHVLSSV